MSHTVLVVDDSEFVRDYHSYILSSAGFSVLSAADGGEGLERLCCHSCDLVLTDINMVHMDGYEFTRRIRAEAAYDSVPVIILSTEKEPKDKIKGLAAGASLYLTKPCAPETLLESVRMLIGGKSA